MKKICLSGILLSLLLSGCGGGGGGETASATPSPQEPSKPPVSNETVKLIDSFTYLNHLSLDHFRPYIYDVAGNNGYLYSLTHCFMSADRTLNVSIYSDGSADTSFSTKNYPVNDACVVSRAFSQQKTNDGPIEANYINGETFYDEKTKTYYDVNHINTSTKLISITNDGMTAVAQDNLGNTTNTKLLKAYKQISLAEVGIEPKSITPFNKGNPGDIMEQGLMENVGIKDTPYSFEGNIFLYKTTGIIKNYSALTAYVIFNNMQIAAQNSNEQNIQNGYITDVFERVNQGNKKGINAQYISNQTFYDYSNKVYYEVNDYVDGTDIIVDITNDGNTAVLQNGKILQVLKSYRKII